MASEAEKRWRGRLRKWQRSGQSVAAFCRAEGVSGASFYAWRRRLGLPEEEATTPELEFVELRGLASPAAAPIEVVLGDVVVRLARGVDGDDLATVLLALEARR